MDYRLFAALYIISYVFTGLLLGLVLCFMGGRYTQYMIIGLTILLVALIVASYVYTKFVAIQTPSTYPGLGALVLSVVGFPFILSMYFGTLLYSYLPIWTVYLAIVLLVSIFIIHFHHSAGPTSMSPNFVLKSYFS